MYMPSYLFDRTPEQKRDMFLSWERDDQSFFASEMVRMRGLEPPHHC